MIGRSLPVPPLTLTVRAWPVDGKPDSRRIDKRCLIGRDSQYSEWVLLDPQDPPTMSRLHCEILPVDGSWRIIDRSKNGTYLNAEPRRIERGQMRELKEGDTIRLGHSGYVVAVQFGFASPSVEPLPGRLDQEPLIAARKSTPAGGWDIPPEAQTPAPGPNGGWDIDLHVKPPIRPTGDGGSGSVPGWDIGQLDGGIEDVRKTSPSTAPPMPQSPPQPQPRHVAPPPLPASPPPMAPSPAPQAVIWPPPADVVANDGTVEAFLRGARMSTLNGVDPQRAMEQAGAALRALIFGLHGIHSSRSTVKREFRIGQSTYDASPNPLRTIGDEEETLRTLLSGRVSAGVAIEEVLTRVKLHEYAMVEAMREAISGLLDALSPREILASPGVPGNGGLLPDRRKARAWEAYERLHAKTVEDLLDDFDSVFGKAFARAYESHMEQALEGDAATDGKRRARAAKVARKPTDKGGSTL